jgi:hypothetical protein
MKKSKILFNYRKQICLVLYRICNAVKYGFSIDKETNSLFFHMWHSLSQDKEKRADYMNQIEFFCS